MKIEIKSINGEVLFSFERENNSVKNTLLECVRLGVDLGGADLEGAYLQGAYLRGAYLEDAYLLGANLEGAYLRGANLRGANLRYANLRDANLRDAYLRGANLRGANLEGANLRDANLRGADLRDANLRVADLRDADLRGANLTVIKNDLFIVLLHSINEIKYLKQNLINGEIDGSTYDGDCCCLSGTLCKNSNNEKLDLILSQRDSLRPIERFFLGIKIGDNPENSQFSKLALDWINEFENLINVK